MAKFKNKFRRGSSVTFTEFNFDPRSNNEILTFVGKVVEFIFDPGLDSYEYRIQVINNGHNDLFWKAERDLFPVKNHR